MRRSSCGIEWRRERRNRSSVCLGFTRRGRYIIVVYEEVDEDSVRVVTAYEVPEPGTR